MKHLVIAILALLSFELSYSQFPCIGGLADGTYPCENVDLLSHVTLGDLNAGFTNDIWGWTDPLDGGEYAIVGKNNGTAFVDITDPLNPIVLGSLPTHTFNSTWRDIKVYNNHAFIVSEAGAHGMQVFDLTRLRDVVSPPETFDNDAHYDGFGDAHNIVINEASGMAYAVGTDFFGGGLFIVDVTDPLNPTLAGDYALDGYTHDAQVVNYIGPDADYAGEQIAFNFNEDAVTIANVTDPSDTQTISITGYSGSSYTHQGWLTEDHQYLLFDDELDEANNGVNTTTRIFDVSDLDAPVLIGTYVASTAAIDHNQYIKGNLSYQSNYRAGLRILDVQNVAAGTLSEVAYFDVYPANDNANFNGSWSNYPYFPSGVIAVGHIEDGLFLVKPTFLRAEANESNVCQASSIDVTVTLEEGFLGPINLSVSGLPAGATASFSANDVMSPSTVTLTIDDLDSASGLVSIEVSGVGVNETYSSTTEFTVDISSTWYIDADDDGYGSAANVVVDCTQPTGYVDNDLDCDDTNENVNEDAMEICDGIDNNCDGQIDEGLLTEFFLDADDDGFGDAAESVMECSAPMGYVADNTDCDDGNSDMYPGAPGTGEGIDNDCNGSVEGDEEALCLGDLNNDGERDIQDLLALLSNFGCTSECTADLDGDGSVGGSDILIFLTVFGQMCP